MSAWGKNDTANNAPKWKNVIAVADGTRGNTLFANTTPNAFMNNATIGIYGVDLAHANHNGAGPGWIMESQFTGPVIGYVVANGGLGYTNADSVTVSNGTVNATGTLVTNATGGVVSVTPVANGAGFTNNSILHIALTSSSNTAAGAVITPTLGGRANRKQYEILASLGSISGNTAEPT